MENDACVAVVEIRVVAAGVSEAETVADAYRVYDVDLHSSRSTDDLQDRHPK